MLIIKGNQIIFLDVKLIECVTVFDHKGECLFKGEEMIDDDLSLSFPGKEISLIVVNFKCGNTRIMHI